MLIFHLTKKLQSKLGNPALSQEHVEASPHLRWYANFFTADRTQYVLTTNAASLFSVVMYKRGLTHDGLYITRFLSTLREHMEHEGLELIYQRCIMPYTGSVMLAKTEDRSALGSMNDMVNMSKFHLGDPDVSPYELTGQLNRTPFSAIDFSYPLEAFAQLPVEGTG